jgi:G3E family GTPase
VVVQCVQHIFHPPVPLDAWPSADTGTRLVFITRNISAEAIRGLQRLRPSDGLLTSLN